MGIRQEGRRHGERPGRRADEGGAVGARKDRPGGAAGRVLAGRVAGTGRRAGGRRPQRGDDPAAPRHRTGGSRGAIGPRRPGRARPAGPDGRPRSARTLPVHQLLQRLAGTKGRNHRGLDVDGLARARVAAFAPGAAAELEVAEAADGHLPAASQLRRDHPVRREEELGDLPGAGARHLEPLGDGTDQLLLVHGVSLNGRATNIAARANAPQGRLAPPPDAA